MASDPRKQKNRLHFSYELPDAYFPDTVIASSPGKEVHDAWRRIYAQKFFLFLESTKKKKNWINQFTIMKPTFIKFEKVPPITVGLFVSLIGPYFKY